MSAGHHGQLVDEAGTVIRYLISEGAKRLRADQVLLLMPEGEHMRHLRPGGPVTPQMEAVDQALNEAQARGLLGEQGQHDAGGRPIYVVREEAGDDR